MQFWTGLNPSQLPPPRMWSLPEALGVKRQRVKRQPLGSTPPSGGGAIALGEQRVSPYEFLLPFGALVAKRVQEALGELEQPAEEEREEPCRRHHHHAAARVQHKGCADQKRVDEQVDQMDVPVG